MENTEENFDYDKIMSDRKLFNEVVYTPLSEAIRLLEERQKDPELMKKVEELLNGDIPEVLKNKKCGVFARQIQTPNFDTQFFIKLAKDSDLEIVLFEYPNDKFVSKNNFKHSLGQIRIFNGINKKGENIIEKINIINLVENDGKKFSEMNTIWGKKLIDFHKELFGHYKLNNNLFFYDISNWYYRNGGNAEKYYVKYLLLFISHGILFDNFLTSKDEEGDFSKNILLPSLKKIYDVLNTKPLIVPMEPTDIENEEYWISHPINIKKHIPIK